MKHSYALVLTSSPTKPALSDFAVERAWQAIPDTDRIDFQWLSPMEAWSARFVSDAPVSHIMGLRDQIATALNGITLDVNIVADDIATRRKKLLIADMDSTIINQECIDEMADALGLKAQISAITERAMRGELEFESALRERLALLSGLTTADLSRVHDERITLMAGARTLVATMRAHGAHTALVSGGFTFFTALVAARVGFDENHANTLDFDGGRLTGRVQGAILGREAKRATLHRLSTERGLAIAATLAVGDGANDLAMIGAAGLGVAYHAKPVVAAEAAASIVHGDLTSLLYLQGYRREDFVNG